MPFSLRKTTRWFLSKNGVRISTLRHKPRRLETSAASL